MGGVLLEPVGQLELLLRLLLVLGGFQLILLLLELRLLLMLLLVGVPDYMSFPPLGELGYCGVGLWKAPSWAAGSSP